MKKDDDKLKRKGIKLTNRGDGVKGHYCIRRMTKDGYAEHWNEGINGWTAFGTLYLSKSLAVKVAVNLTF